MSPSAPRPAQPPALKRLAAQALPLSFEALRRDGIALVQALSGSVWTDYNLHDPGVTLLEALCFALTEQAYRAEEPVAALLAGGDGRIDWARHALHAAPECLPTRPVTREDYERFLLDQVPELAQLSMEPIGVGGTSGVLWRLSLLALARGSGDTERMAEDALRAYQGRRNLCEDVESRPKPLERRECRLAMAVSVVGSRDPVEILADCYALACALVAGEADRQSSLERIGDGLSRGQGLDSLLEGPLLGDGRNASGRSPASAEDRLFFGDLAARLAAIEGVVRVSALRLTVEGGADAQDSLPLRGPGWSLQLRWPSLPEDLDGITVTRLGAPVSVPAQSVLLRLRSAAQAGFDRERGGPGPPAASAWGLPEERERGADPFVPAQSHLPALYRQAGVQRSWDGYLALFEQWLAHAQEQALHVKDLFAIDPEPLGSYSWRMLDDLMLPGIEGLYRGGVPAIQREVFETLDDVLERRHRVLDFLLALYGTDWPHRSLQPFGHHHAPQAWQGHLYECKRRLAENIVFFTRDRMGAFDYTRPSLDVEGNTSALQQRLGLELGFVRTHSRGLTRSFRESGFSFGDAHGGHAERHAAPPHGPGHGSQVPFAAPQAGRGANARWHDLIPQVRLLGGRRLHPAFWRCAVHADRYRLAPLGAGLGLVLGPDEQGQWWSLAERPSGADHDRKALGRIAHDLRELVSQGHRDAEGLHLVEHLLLRQEASGGGATDRFDEAFDAMGLTLVFSAWTACGSDFAFRRLAENALARHLPAHVTAECLWLDYPEMEAFEGLHRAWLDELRARATGGDAGRTPGIHASALRAWLKEAAKADAADRAWKAEP